MELTIRMKHSNHKNGPKVDPCPGPKSSESCVFLFDTDDTPYFVLI
jgi:hypothetical protein